jgi:acyl carrier protein
MNMVNLEQARNEILDWVAGALQIPADKINLDTPLNELGIDSLDAVHLIATIESVIQQELSEDVVQKVGSLNQIFEMMAQRLEAA